MSHQSLKVEPMHQGFGVGGEGGVKGVGGVKGWGPDPRPDVTFT